MQKIGQNLKQIRELKNFTQEYVAGKLKVSRASYIKMENNEIDVKFEQLQKIADIFGVTLNDLISFSDKNLFNTTHHNHNVKNVGNIINDFQHEEMKSLYEKLLHEREQRLLDKDEMIKQLKEIIAKKLK